MRFVMLKKPTKESGETSEVDILKSVVNNASGKGYGVKDMRRALKILDKLDQVPEPEGTLALEDDEHGFLRKMYGETTFRVVNQVIVDLSDKLDNAPSKLPS